ncbi:hypothetical protein CCACVL1_13608 [Corchorus capsularis]|uniref:Uncharacterized protein n=1 Tax=Corchorus capsularis TaxID=210143 RepID=A0A1R3IAJ1_COCAP|nr:hypothetical protein CCACVL1_13608 [Corchorus capsularis]
MASYRESPTKDGHYMSIVSTV